MDFSALWKKLTDRESPFLAGWTWITLGFTVAVIGAFPLLLYMMFENVTGSTGGNPIGLELLAMAAFGLSQLCLLLALIWMAYGIFRMFYSPTS